MLIAHLLIVKAVIIINLDKTKIELNHECLKPLLKIRQMRLFMKQMFVIIRCMIIVQVNIKGNLKELCEDWV